MHSAGFFRGTAFTARTGRFRIREGRHFVVNRLKELDAVARAGFDAKAAFDAFITVNDRQTAVDVLFHRNCLRRTFFHAQAAADAGNAAMSHRGLALGSVIAFDVNFVKGVAQIQYLLRALLHTYAAAGTFFVVDDGQAVCSERNRVKGTDIDTEAESEAAIIALVGTAEGPCDHVAFADSLVVVWFGQVVVAAVAGKTGYLP